MYNPKSEQIICITCGFCCDGTIFSTATLQRGEKGNLPEKIEENYFVKDDKEYFKLPCQYFSYKCTIYTREKAIVCSAYRCQLLKDLAEKKITKRKALEKISLAKSSRAELFEQYKSISGTGESICFRQLLLELGEKTAATAGNEKQDMDSEVLAARCNIFEALLIKHFRSAKDFDNMMEDEEDKNE